MLSKGESRHLGIKISNLYYVRYKGISHFVGLMEQEWWPEHE